MLRGILIKVGIVLLIFLVFAGYGDYSSTPKCAAAEEHRVRTAR